VAHGLALGVLDDVRVDVHGDADLGVPILASYDAYTAPEADNWVAATLRTIAPALTPGASDEAWEWLYDGRIKARRALLRFEPCEVSVTQASTRIIWMIRPVLFLPLADRQDGKLPTCAYSFKPHASP